MLSVMVTGVAGMAFVKMPLSASSCSWVLVAVALNLLFNRISSKPMNVWATMPFSSWHSPQALREGKVVRERQCRCSSISGLPLYRCA